jgi:hypothetical protein
MSVLLSSSATRLTHSWSTSIGFGHSMDEPVQPYCTVKHHILFCSGSKIFNKSILNGVNVIEHTLLFRSAATHPDHHMMHIPLPVDTVLLRKRWPIALVRSGKVSSSPFEVWWKTDADHLPWGGNAKTSELTPCRIGKQYHLISHEITSWPALGLGCKYSALNYLIEWWRASRLLLACIADGLEENSADHMAQWSKQCDHHAGPKYERISKTKVEGTKVDGNKFNAVSVLFLTSRYIGSSGCDGFLASYTGGVLFLLMNFSIACFCVEH